MGAGVLKAALVCSVVGAVISNNSFTMLNLKHKTTFKRKTYVCIALPHVEEDYLNKSVNTLPSSDKQMCMNTLHYRLKLHKNVQNHSSEVN